MKTLKPGTLVRYKPYPDETGKIVSSDGDSVTVDVGSIGFLVSVSSAEVEPITETEY